MIRKIKTYKFVTFTDLSSCLSIKYETQRAEGCQCCSGPIATFKKKIESAEEYFPIFLYFQKCEVTVVHCPIWHISVIDDENMAAPQRHATEP